MHKNTVGTFTVLALGALVAVGQPTFARPDRETSPSEQEYSQGQEYQKGQGRQQAGGQLQRLAHELNLTREQRTELKAILRDSREQSKSLREDQELSQQDRRAQLRELRTATEERINEILTPEQQEKYAQLREELRPGRRGHGASQKTKQKPERRNSRGSRQDRATRDDQGDQQNEDGRAYPQDQDNQQDQYDQQNAAYPQASHRGQGADNQQDVGQDDDYRIN
jgi:Spy/CpxP family protein refolding chaperone